jgi:quercetin dioxygenase-like cupin family protein
MIIAHEKEAQANLINSPAVKHAAMKVLVGPAQGWSDYVMRIVELNADGFSPKHTHPWPHINYMLEGRGVLEMDGREHPVEQGAYAYIPGGCEHQFRNAGQGKFRFICIVPKEGHQ